MKKILNLRILFVFAVAFMPLVSSADTFFNDTFSSGSTVNSSQAAPTPTSTSYQTYIGAASGDWSISPGHLVMTNNTSSTLQEFVALFTNTPVALTAVGDYVAFTVTFVNSNNILGAANNANSSLSIGLYNSGGVKPNQGNIRTDTGNTNGGTEKWIGYIGRIFHSGNVSVLTRPQQTQAGTTSQNQELLHSNASSTQAFNNPSGTQVGSSLASAVTLTNGQTYTMRFVISLNGVNSLAITNTLYAGAGTGGGVLFTQSAVATNATFLTGGFDGLAVGWRNTSGAAQPNAMDITSIQVTGQSTPDTSLPVITKQPVSVTVPNGASCAFDVSAAGFGLAYQWHRNGTNLLNSGNISGANSDLLVISPAGAADVSSSYYVTITGASTLSTNSFTNSLAFTTATNLIWAGDVGLNTWDVNTTADWKDTNGNTTTFNFGNPVLFDDSATLRTVVLNGRYLSAASATVDNTLPYTFAAQSSGGLAGPGNLIYKGSSILTIANVNTHTGGTIISNATALLFLQNYNGLGTGPVTLAKAGGAMEITPAGSAALGVGADIQVQDDFTIQFDTPGTFSGVFFGNFSGTSGKSLTLNPNPANTTTNQRVRIYGANTTYDANMVLNSSLITLAPYLTSGSQTYNGVISGPGNLIQRGNGATILNGQNTYSGGTTPTAGSIGFGADTVGSVTSGPIGTGPLFIAPEVGSANGSGTIFASGGTRTIANLIQFPSATNNQTLAIGGTNALTLSGAFTLNGNDSLGPVTNRTLSVTNMALTTISSVISDGGLGFGLIKAGNGILALSNTETYSGPTLVNGGTLRVNGQIGSGAVTVAAILGGTGTITGPVTVQTNGTIAPGNSIGTLNLSSSLTLSGNLNIEVNTSLGTTSDKTIVSGTLTNAGVGSVIVTNLGPALVAGNTFTLFNKAMSNGVALTITGGNVAWNNKLAIDGTIVVAGPLVNLTPTNIVAVLNGSNLELSWPADHTGWILQAQTNALSVGINTNWVDINGSTTVHSVTNPIDPANGTVFYRLIHP